MMPRILRCHPGIGPRVTGVALTAEDDFSARYDLDRQKGLFSRQGHKLYGHSYVDKILVLRTAKGGVASAWMLREMVEQGLAPKALIFDTVNPILAQGAAFANLPMVDRFEDDRACTVIRTDDQLEIDPHGGTVKILNRD
jgi:predicted aconitase with swiveling domain